MYGLTPEGRRRLVWRPVLPMLLPIGVGALFGAAAAKWLYGVAGLLALAVLYELWKRGRYWSRYRLVVEPDRIAEPPRHEIHPRQIVRLVEVAGQYLVAQTVDPRQDLLVPAGLAGYEEVRDFLARWHPVAEPSPARGRWAGRIGHATAATVLVSLIGAVASGRWAVVALAALLVAALVAPGIRAHRKPC